MEILYARFVWFCRHISGLLILALIGVLLLNIASRELLALALPWANEVALALFVWVAFLGGGVAFAENVRIRFDFLVNRLPSRLRHALEVFLHYVGLVLLIGLMVTGAYVAWVYRDQTFTTLQASVVWQMAAVPVGTFVAVVGWARHGTWWRSSTSKALVQAV